MGTLSRGTKEPAHNLGQDTIMILHVLNGLVYWETKLEASFEHAPSKTLDMHKFSHNPTTEGFSLVAAHRMWRQLHSQQILMVS